MGHIDVPFHEAEDWILRTGQGLVHVEGRHRFLALEGRHAETVGEESANLGIVAFHPIPLAFPHFHQTAVEQVSQKTRDAHRVGIQLLEGLDVGSVNFGAIGTAHGTAVPVAAVKLVRPLLESIPSINAKAGCPQSLLASIATVSQRATQSVRGPFESIGVRLWNGEVVAPAKSFLVHPRAANARRLR